MLKKNPSPKNSTQISGFTLIEMAIVIVIGALILSLMAGYLNNALKQSKIAATNVRINGIEQALRQYALRNNRFPKPAARTETINTATYAREIAGSATPPGVIDASGTGGRRVLIGMVPTRTINLPDEYAYDGWGNRLVYAVTEVLTSTSTFDMSQGAIAVEDAAGNSMVTPDGSVTYLLLSPGPDREDGYTAAGVQTSSCSTGELDSENCDGNSEFVDTLSSSDTGAAQFDDYVVYEANFTATAESIPEGAIMAFNTTVCPPGWSAVADMAGRSIVGSGAYTETGMPPTANIPTYNGEDYALGDTGGYATRVNGTPSAARVANMPPCKAYLYCEKMP